MSNEEHDPELAAAFSALVDRAFADGATRDDVRQALETAMQPREPQEPGTIVASDGWEDLRVWVRLSLDDTNSPRPWLDIREARGCDWREVCRHGIPRELVDRVAPEPDLIDGSGDQWFWHAGSYSLDPQPLTRRRVVNDHGFNREVHRDGAL